MSTSVSKIDLADEQARLALLIGVSLRAGLGIAATLVVLGMVLLLFEGGPPTDFHLFSGHASVGAHGVVAVIAHRQHRRLGADVIDLGLFVLILTPVVRVAMSLLVFVREKDWLYAGITTIVFAILICSLLSG